MTKTQTNVAYFLFKTLFRYWLYWFCAEVKIPDAWLARTEGRNNSCSRCGVYIRAVRQPSYHVQIKLVVADVDFHFPWALCEQRRKGNVMYAIDPLC